MVGSTRMDQARSKYVEAEICKVDDVKVDGVKVLGSQMSVVG